MPSLTPKPKTLNPKLYGRRKGRPLSLDLKQAVESASGQYFIDKDNIASAAPAGIDPKFFFKILSPLASRPPTSYWLEIGFGTGDFLAGQAAQHPDINIIGCEAFENGIAKTMQKLLAHKVSNVRIYPDDVRHLLPKLQDGCLDRVFLLFPDPWPKKRHAKRRFVNPDNVRELARVIKKGGEFWVATDDPTYQEWVPEQMSAQSWFQPKNPPTDGFWHLTEPQPWVETNYQKKARRAGRIPKFVVFSNS
ncbi:MAG: tRNA (guanosine(46)-N7)-methyltransferase TrmB [Alphaproteobacteria bacterium]|nr:MAG: tRNA (guanosine(46)-N7)-methyltransferase TrmB [Alphaproteobacteria bacterium]